MGTRPRGSLAARCGTAAAAGCTHSSMQAPTMQMQAPSRTHTMFARLTQYFFPAQSLLFVGEAMLQVLQGCVDVSGCVFVCPLLCMSHTCCGHMHQLATLSVQPVCLHIACTQLLA